MARTKPRYWIGVDGEGIGRNPHRYVFLAAADTKGRSWQIENVRGLPTEDCLDFFLSLPGDGRICGYYLGYDWTMILKDVPNKKVYRLLRPELRTLPRGEGGGFSRVHWGDYKLHYLSSMMRIGRRKHSVTVWDVGKFFQAPFVDSIVNWGVKTDAQSIAEMKAIRSEFSELTPRIRAYCLDECAALAELATSLETAHADIGLRPKSWHGPGSTASVSLHTMGIRDKRGEIPEEVKDAANRAFFGGRFEHSTIGKRDNVNGYDIVSAYPFQAYNLPCLEHGTWVKVSRERALKDCKQAAVHFRVNDIGSRAWAPLPCRLTNGSIVFARGGFTGWCWLDEWRAARAWEGVEFLDAWSLMNECVCRPFEKVLGWFRERIALGKSQRGRVLKLALNSIYGKLAQAVGQPKYGSRVWAGMITSGTRAHLLDLLLRHVNHSNVIAMATDGLYSTELIQGLPVPLAPDTLGSWEHETHGTMVFVRPGIYWSETDDTLRARGIGRRKVSEQRATVLDAIERGIVRADLGTSTVFGGARACIYDPEKHKRSRLYGEWHDIPARINLTPLPKRNPDWSLRMLEGVVSAPYKVDTVSDDGKLLRLAAEMFWASK